MVFEDILLLFLLRMLLDIFFCNFNRTGILLEDWAKQVENTTMWPDLEKILQPVVSYMESYNKQMKSYIGM